MAKYFKLPVIEGALVMYQTDTTPKKFIPHDPANRHFEQMMKEVDEGTSTIEEVDDTPE